MKAGVDGESEWVAGGSEDESDSDEEEEEEEKEGGEAN